MTPRKTMKDCFGGYNDSGLHNDVVMGRDYWKNLKTIGCKCRDQFCHCWLAMETVDVGSIVEQCYDCVEYCVEC